MPSNTSLYSDKTDLLSKCLRVEDVGFVGDGDSIAMISLINFKWFQTKYGYGISFYNEKVDLPYPIALRASDFLLT